jgi:hypothetical protein
MPLYAFAAPHLGVGDRETFEPAGTGTGNASHRHLRRVLSSLSSFSASNVEYPAMAETPHERRGPDGDRRRQENDPIVLGPLDRQPSPPDDGDDDEEVDEEQ